LVVLFFCGGAILILSGFLIAAREWAAFLWRFISHPTVEDQK